MQARLSLLWKQYRWRMLAGFLVLLIGGVVFTVPQLRAKASGLKSLVLGGDSAPVTIVTDQGVGDQLNERVQTLEAEVTALKQARQGDADLITKLQADYQAAVSEVASTQDALLKQVSSVAKSTPSPLSPVEPSPGKISINHATASQLDTLPGIGPSYAQRIIDYRNEHGPFKSIDDLDKVTGIGPATIEKIRGMVEL
jgi:comEA protein